MSKIKELLDDIPIISDLIDNLTGRDINIHIGELHTTYGTFKDITLSSNKVCAKKEPTDSIGE